MSGAREKRRVILIVVLALLLGLGYWAFSVKVDLGESERYSSWDRILAVADVRLNFLGMFGCRLERVYYAGDERSQAEYDYYSQHQQEMGREFDECIVFHVDFHTPRATLSMNPDSDYIGWGYIMGRKNGGLWHVLTQGYG